MRVDYQAHWFPKPCFDPIVGRDKYPRATLADGDYMFEAGAGLGFKAAGQLLELDWQFENAARHGIDVLVSSPMELGEAWDYGPSEAAEWFEALNEEFAHAQRRYAGKFVGLAMLPLNHFETALEVLDKAIANGLRGVCILTSVDGEPIATETTLPLYRRIEEAGMTVFLHPCFRSGAVRSANRTIENGVGWMYQTTAAALALVTTGTLDACPNLKVIHPHLGGVLPYVAGRISKLNPQPGAAEHGLDYYLRRNFYVDTASFTPGALRLAIDTYGIDRVVFGADSPLFPMRLFLDFVEENCAPDEAVTIMANVPEGLSFGSDERGGVR